MSNHKSIVTIYYALLCPEREEKHCFATVDKVSIESPCFTDQNEMKFSTVIFQAELPVSMHRKKAIFWNFYLLYMSQKPFISSSFMLSIWIPPSLPLLQAFSEWTWWCLPSDFTEKSGISQSPQRYCREVYRPRSKWISNKSMVYQSVLANLHYFSQTLNYPKWFSLQIDLALAESEEDFSIHCRKCWIRLYTFCSWIKSYRCQ